jgi:glycosyltransferase involved in cell wall biosynthesis
VHPFAVDAGRKAACRARAAFVYQVRDLWPDTLIDLGAVPRWHPLCLYFRHIERAAFRAAHGVTGVMPGIVRYAMERGVPRERIWWLPNGVEPSLYPENDYPADAAPFILSYFGTHGSTNALRRVVEAAALIRDRGQGQDLLIRLVGDGPEKAALQRQAAELGLRNVEFLGPVPKAEVAQLAAKSHAFLFTLPVYRALTEYGLSSNKLFDYLAAGRPVVFACSSMNDPIAEAEAGISVASPDPILLADAILRLRSLPWDERRRMGASGRQYLLRQHDLAKIATQWDVFLRQTWQRAVQAGDVPGQPVRRAA